jgi:hypothetical protein
MVLIPCTKILHFLENFFMLVVKVFFYIMCKNFFYYNVLQDYCDIKSANKSIRITKN